MEAIIRKRKKEDAQELAHAIATVWNDTYKGIVNEEFLNNLFNYENDSAEKIKKHIVDQPNYYILEINNRIAGWIYFELDSDKYKDAAEIHSLYILKEYQGKGYGKKLYNFAVDMIKKNKIEKLVIGCLDGNKSNDFYKHIGGKYIKSGLFRDEYKENYYLFNLC